MIDSPSSAAELFDQVETDLEEGRGDRNRKRYQLLGRWAVQGAVAVQNKTVAYLRDREELLHADRWLWQQIVLVVDGWVHHGSYWWGPPDSLAKPAVIRGAGRPVGGIAPAQPRGSAPSATADIASLTENSATADVTLRLLSDKDLEEELAAIERLRRFLEMMAEPKGYRQRQLRRAEILGRMMAVWFSQWPTDLRDRFVATLDGGSRLLFSITVLRADKWL